MSEVQKRTEPKSCPSCILFFRAELVLAHSAEGALEVVADFFPLLALLVFVEDPAANVTDVFHKDFLLLTDFYSPVGYFSLYPQAWQR